MPHDYAGSFSPGRRDLMKAIGGGAALAALGGPAAAQDEGAGTETTQPADGDTGEPRTGTVHEVTTQIQGPSTNPERPADFFYQPTGLHVQPGDVVKFVFETPDHNVVSYHPAYGMRRRVPTDVDAFSSPLLGWRATSIPGDQREPPAETGDEDGDGDGDGVQPVPDTWLHAFDTPGVYDILCSPHETFGMAMRVVVGDVTETEFETTDPESLPEPRAGPVGLARLTLTDPALQPSNVVAEGTVPWESLQANQPAETTTED
ncbi:plastocyanin/azurin family copper-binding protein [Halobacteriaceae archaeon GCM10025711]